MNNQIEVVVFDIDGTLSDRRHRLHYLEGKKNWKGFFKEIVNDPPIKSTVIELDKHLKKGRSILFLTGRPEQYRKETERWLKENTPAVEYQLIMRADKHHEKDLIFKERIYNTELKDLKIYKVYDDNDELLMMWKSKGLITVNCSID